MSYGAGGNFHLDIVDVEFVAFIIIRLKVPRFIEIVVVYGRFVGLPLLGRFVPIAFNGVECLVGARGLQCGIVFEILCRNEFGVNRLWSMWRHKA